MKNYQKEWESSYAAGDNFVFYPHEEVIRFISKYIVKRTGLHTFLNHCGDKPLPEIKALDLGCGIGRHFMYLREMGLNPHGVDLSERAIQMAREWAEEKGFSDIAGQLLSADIRNLPWPDGYFQLVISHGVLDSMPFDTALAAVKETARVMEVGGLFYCDLISGDDSTHGREFAEEELVATKQEHGTIQSYFNFTKIKTLFEKYFDLTDGIHIRNRSLFHQKSWARYHLVCKKRLESR